jgi:hypothetical protein
MLPPAESLILSLFFLAIILTIILTLIDNLFYSLQKRLKKRWIKTEKITVPSAGGFRGKLKSISASTLYVLLILCLAIIPLMTNLKGTILNANFIVAELNKLSLRAALTQLYPQDLTGTELYKAETVNATLTAIGPAIKSQADQIIYEVYPYLLGQSQTLQVSVSLAILQESLRFNLEQVIFQSPPIEFLGYTPEQKKDYIDNTYTRLFRHIPANMQISSDVSTAIPLNDVRNWIGIFKLVSILFIPLTLLVCLGIILITRKVKEFTRKLGTSILLGGILGFTYAYVLKLLGFVSGSLFPLSELQKWSIQVTIDILAVVHSPGIWIIMIGVAMMVVSLGYERWEQIRAQK